MFIYRGIPITLSLRGYSWPNAGYFDTLENCERDIDSAFLSGELGGARDDLAQGIV